MKISDLQGKKLAELKDIARNMNLTGFSTLRKQDLIYLIIEVDQVTLHEVHIISYRIANTDLIFA